MKVSENHPFLEGKIPTNSGGRGEALSVEKVSKIYEKRTTFWRRKTVAHKALEDLSFLVHEGETLGLLGPNGAGKTTTLKIISRMLTPSSGRVSIFGHDIAQKPKNSSELLGLVTCDERSFYWRLTGRQNLEFFATLYHVPETRAKQRIAEFLETLGLAHAADRPYHSYSTGMKQKMSIARGLLSDPRMVLYDEPTRSLDPVSAQNIRAWMIENRKRRPHQASILATNLLHEAELLCDRVIIINRGRLVDGGTIAEIRSRWDNRETAVHRILYQGGISPGVFDNLGSIAVLEQTPSNGEPGLLRVETPHRGPELSLILTSLLRNGVGIVECHSELRPFDEVFCSMMERG